MSAMFWPFHLVTEDGSSARFPESPSLAGPNEGGAGGDGGVDTGCGDGSGSVSRPETPPENNPLTDDIIRFHRPAPPPDDRAYGVGRRAASARRDGPYDNDMLCPLASSANPAFDNAVGTAPRIAEEPGVACAADPHVDPATRIDSSGAQSDNYH